MNKLNYKYETLTPFKICVLENFPFLEADFDALTNYEIMCKLAEYINKVAKNQNLVQSNIIELNNWFNNLDVQEEINNKLDSMAESGELTEIIGQYINLHGVLAFNTVSDMKAGENLVENSICKTLGFTTYNDGRGSYYKIRNITSSDVVDNINIISINNSNTLIAEKINPIPKSKYVFIGDSYLQGYTPNGEVENWGKKLSILLNLESSQWRRIAKGGTALNITNPNNFYELIKNIDIDETVTDVILAAGYNDHQDIGTSQSIEQGLIAFKNKVKEKFPNATLKIGFIGNTNITQDRYGVVSKCPYYINSCSNNSVIYLNNVEYALHNYGREFSSDGIHPNDEGQKVIAKALYQAITTGSANVKRERTPVKSAGSSFYMEQDNNLITFISNSYYSGDFSEEKTITMSGGNSILIYEQFDNSLAIGCGSSYLENTTTIPVFFVTTANKTILVDCKVTIDNGFLVLYPFKLNDEGTNYYTDTIKSFQLRPFTYTMNALYN